MPARNERPSREAIVYFTDDSLFPENMPPTIITAAPYGAEWLKGDVEDLPMSGDEQVQASATTRSRTRCSVSASRRRPEGYRGFLTDETDARLPKAPEARTSTTSVP
jgi:hypothetical protein